MNINEEIEFESINEELKRLQNILKSLHQETSKLLSSKCSDEYREGVTDCRIILRIIEDK
jgi:hypothetical protein